MRRGLWLAGAALAGMAACGGPGGPASPESAAPTPSRAPVERSSPESEPGGGKSARPQTPPDNPAPDFSFETFDGAEFSLAEQRGTPVVLNFWESW
jgi:hypothetical protein